MKQYEFTFVPKDEWDRLQSKNSLTRRQKMVIAAVSATIGTFAVASFFAFVVYEFSPSMRFKPGSIVRVNSGYYQGIVGEVTRVRQDLRSVERYRGKRYNIEPTGSYPARDIFDGLPKQIDAYDDELEPWIASVKVPKFEPDRTSTHWVVWPNGMVTTFEEYCREQNVIPKGYGDMKPGFHSVVSYTKPTKETWPFGDWPASKEQHQ